MSTRNIDLVTFENDSVLNQKSISLPIGKVSIRQTAILFSGILVTFLVFMTSDNLIMSGFVFAVFLGLGLIGSRVMAADQMIKSHLILLIRGTSLDIKPEYLEKKKKKQQQQQINNNAIPNSKQEIESQKNNNELVNKVLSDIQSLLLLFKKKDIQQKEQHENDILQENDTQKISEDKRYSAKVELTDQNILNVSLYKKTKQNQIDNDHDHDDDRNTVEKMLRNLLKKQTIVKPPKENLTQHVTIALDEKKLEQSQYAIKSNDIISLVLENNPDVMYQVTATADDDNNNKAVTV
ncbi:MAG: hypothetical protein OEW78_08025 [Nitrosopumilus sp.]|uniref:hypothetical protein n=1 Tax=Nitrosopumilus sp. TaxID=2024843 RepID=UPI0024728B0D|nr:hypothetical protein [Nitrosopumilus sp.]MDH5431809.1 hypothetical protein [Nitrosopumilus sp.]